MRDNRQKIQNRKRMYPKGCRVVLDSMDDIQAPAVGTQGTVTGVDDMGTIHVSWDGGGSLGICPEGGDSAHRIASEDEYKVTLDHFGRIGKQWPVCPRCGGLASWDEPHHALSRRAGISVCSGCGAAEALEDFYGRHTPLANWYAIELDRNL